MKVNKIKNIEKIVKEILEEDELARRDDCYLILKVVEKLYPMEVGKTFYSVMISATNRGISFETITRARRRVQQKNPWLKDEETSKIREEEQKEYIDYALDRNSNE